MTDLISALQANGILLANASSNTANLNTRDYHSITTTLAADATGQVSAITSRTTTPGVPDGDGHESSNVDLPREVCDMMRAQRGFEAILSAISTREDMLDGLMNTLMEAGE